MSFSYLLFFFCVLLLLLLLLCSSLFFCVLLLLLLLLLLCSSLFFFVLLCSSLFFFVLLCSSLFLFQHQRAQAQAPELHPRGGRPLALLPHAGGELLASKVLVSQRDTFPSFTSLCCFTITTFAATAVTHSLMPFITVIYYCSCCDCCYF
jgi:hypothetical protein